MEPEVFAGWSFLGWANDSAPSCRSLDLEHIQTECFRSEPQPRKRHMLFLLLFFLGKMKGLKRSHTNVNTQDPRSGRQMLGRE